MRIMMVALLVGCGADNDRDRDGWVWPLDCNDFAVEIHPGRPEVPFDGIDNDCDSETSDIDADGDGLLPPRDCFPDDPELPSQEIRYDGVDNDCNPTTLDDDIDGDGFGIADDCDDLDARINPAATETASDGIDFDCDPLTTDDDLDGDGVVTYLDCDDSSAQIGGGGAWYTDCDGDGFAPFDADVVIACEAPAVLSCPIELGVGRWVTREPVGSGEVVGNTTVDCDDEASFVNPDQTVYSAFGYNDGIWPYDHNCDGQQVVDHPFADCFQIGPTDCQIREGYSDYAECGFTYLFYDTCVFEDGMCTLVDGVEQAAACL